MRSKLARAFLSGLIAVSLAGCGGNAAVYGAAPAQAGAVVVNQGLTISITLGETASNIINGLGILTILIVANGVIPDPPRMKEDRVISEQDCTQPIVSTTANLMCR